MRSVDDVVSGSNISLTSNDQSQIEAWDFRAVAQRSSPAVGRGALTEICQATYVQYDIAGASHYWGGGGENPLMPIA